MARDSIMEHANEVLQQHRLLFFIAIVLLCIGLYLKYLDHKRELQAKAKYLS